MTAPRAAAPTTALSTAPSTAPSTTPANTAPSTALVPAEAAAAPAGEATTAPGPATALALAAPLSPIPASASEGAMLVDAVTPGDGLRSAAETLAMGTPDERRAMLDRLPPDLVAAFEYHWPLWQRPAQREPIDRWRTWLVMAGRGFGKTRMGAEWVRAVAQRTPTARIALMAATYAEARSVMVEGAAGVLAVHPFGERPRFDPSLRRLEWPNGATAQLFSASEPEALRGPEHTHAWGDEVAKWAGGLDAWNALAITVRAGRAPRLMATTTPRPVPLVRELLRTARVTRGATAANRAHLAPEFLTAMAAYAGTRLARQELDGELIEELAGALWTRGGLERSRHVPTGEPVRVVVGVDPPAGTDGDACGIVVCARDAEGRATVLEDASRGGLSPEGWAGAVAAAARRHGADRVIAEANQGGDMVRAVLMAADGGLPVTLVHASRGKVARAEPVSLKYARGLVRHEGAMPELEDELCGFTNGGWTGPGRSPDRADALIWALTELLLSPRGEPSVRML